ncbi:MAG: putative membrane protein insertion efficiency factor [Paracidovorax wautersii]|uniref:Putative membrane protein insertion efficiency factor n=1 Tax=Paracidovorax wautersii TaxID=1177982 RepID=A0A7V8FPL9_9BURK|nr:MAG: putative membrane protein insertion efficiency factor [Paracidovorax wautersii]
MTRAPHRPQGVAAWPRRVLMGLVWAYRLLLSPWLGASCRFEPTCSQYALQVLERHGALAGSYLTLHRLVRCNPWCAGGHDPAPEQAPRLFSRLLPCTSSLTPADRPADPLTSSKKLS